MSVAGKCDACGGDGLGNNEIHLRKWIDWYGNTKHAWLCKRCYNERVEGAKH